MTPTSPSPEPPGTDETQPVADLGGAPLPTAATLRRRASVPFQLTRFVAFNVRILRMAATGHGSHPHDSASAAPAGTTKGLP